MNIADEQALMILRNSQTASPELRLLAKLITQIQKDGSRVVSDGGDLSDRITAIEERLGKIERKLEMFG